MGETYIIGDYYIEEGFLKMIYDEIKADILKENAIEAQRRRRKKHEAMERKKYFANQKLVGGVYAIAMTVTTLLVGNPACIMLALPGFYAMKTRKMILVNDYWYEHGGAEQNWLGKEWKWLNRLIG